MRVRDIVERLCYTYTCRLTAGNPYYIEILEKAFDGSISVELMVRLSLYAYL